MEGHHLLLHRPGTHRFSTLFTAQDVRRSLASEEGLNQAMDWCKQTAVTKVYIESYRDGYTAKKAALENARDKFKAAGFVVSGCVTPTKVGKPSTGWKDTISCYTDPARIVFPPCSPPRMCAAPSPARKD